MTNKDAISELRWWQEKSISLQAVEAFDIAIRALEVDIGEERIRAYNNGYKEGYQMGLKMRKTQD